MADTVAWERRGEAYIEAELKLVMKKECRNARQMNTFRKEDYCSKLLTVLKSAALK